MTAHLHELLDRIQAAGVNLSINGTKLHVRTKTPMPDDLVEELRQAKPALLEHLRGDGWDAEDWQTLFQERIAIAEHDGGLAPKEAERQAANDCIEFWLHQNPPLPSGPERCAHCRNAISRVGEDGIPVLTRDGHTWVHHQCWESWVAQRRAEAETALAVFEITKPENSANPSVLRRPA